MTAIRKAQHGYGSQTRAIKTPKSTEYEAFAKITHRITTAAKSGKRGIGELAEALHDNRRLWTLLALDVANENNPLPKQLRAQILYLAEFTQLHSSKVLNEGAPVDPLVDINSSVMAGLRHGGGAL